MLERLKSFFGIHSTTKKMEHSAKKIQQIFDTYANKGMFPLYDQSVDKWILTKGYILFRCHPTNVLNPKIDEDTEKVGCYFCDNCPRLALSMVYEHKDEYPNGLVLNVYKLTDDILCNNGKYSPENHYDTVIESLYSWIDYNGKSIDKDMWCHEIFLQSDELSKLEQIDELIVTPQDVMNFYKTNVYDDSFVLKMVLNGTGDEIGMVNQYTLQKRNEEFMTGVCNRMNEVRK